MPIAYDKIWVYRIIHCHNLKYILQNGIYYRNSPKGDPDYVNIGSAEIINRRDNVIVQCFPNTTVNEFVPFYFAIRTPMLYKIKTGHGVTRRPQHEIIYLCCKLSDIISGHMQWCFTDGNAATSITSFYNDIANLDQLDWKSIKEEKWSADNPEGDTDRMRKKHSEFLVKEYVPVKYIKAIVVLTKERQEYVQDLLAQFNLDIPIHVDTQSKFYY